MGSAASRLEWMALGRVGCGTAVWIRPVRSDDGAELRATFGQGIPPWMRAPGAGPSAVVTVGDWLAQRAAGSDSHGTLVATVGVGERERIAGAACFTPEPGGRHGRAEIALGVAEPWRGRGMGKLLLTCLIRSAREAGISELYAPVIFSNLPVLHLIEKSDSPPQIDWREAPPRARVRLVPAG